MRGHKFSLFRAFAKKTVREIYALYLQSCGVDIYYEQYGDTGPDILLLHGWGCDVSLWKPVIDRLSGAFHVTALDFPGHGKSGKPPEPWDARAFARMTADVIGQLGISGCAIIGHSHGGRTALRLALDYPDALSKLIITSGSGLRAKPSAAKTLRQRSYKIMKSGLLALEKARVFGSLPERGLDALRQRFGSADYRALSKDMRGTFVLLVNTDLTDELHKISVPTLLIWGDKDTETPLWMGELMEREIPDSGLVVFEGADHFAYLREPDRFCRVVASFCGGS